MMPSLVQLAAVGAALLQLGSPVVLRGGDGSDASTGAFAEDPTKEVWIAAFPRSASSTLMWMMNISSDENDAFTVFEPCHDGDLPPVTNCQQLIADLAACDFSNIDHLWGWVAGGYGDYDKKNASELCAKSKKRIFKTVAKTGMDLKKSFWLTDSRPNMSILHLVRDPRAIVASWIKTDEFSTNKAMDGRLWTEVCDSYASNLNVSHPRIRTVFMEDMVISPESFMRDIYEYLGYEFGQGQFDWVSRTFPPTNHDCHQEVNGAGHKRHREFAECHGRKEALEDLFSWQDVLSEDIQAAILSYPACEQVLNTYGYMWAYDNPTLWGYGHLAAPGEGNEKKERKLLD